MPYYIQRRGESNVVVTIEEYEDSKQSYAAAREYGRRDPTARYYVAKKPCKAWKGNQHSVPLCEAAPNFM
jgi:hypothetical protein